MEDKELIKDITIAKEKAKAIIESCITCDHFNTVIPYIELYHKQFNDEDTYKELLDLYKKKYNELHCK